MATLRWSRPERRGSGENSSLVIPVPSLDVLHLRIAVEGTRGPVRFSRAPGLGVWQWTWAPIQVVDRDPSEHDRFRVLHAG
ncbi:hypothetical protein STANM309S_02577 [Streptomyces tanashiensis]